MKDETGAIIHLRVDEGNYLHTYDDANDKLVYPGYVCVGNPTIAVGILLNAAGLQALKDVGVVDPQAVLEGRADITQAQADQITRNLIPRYVGYARAVLPEPMYDTLSPARQYALLSMAWNMGQTGIAAWKPTWALFIKAQNAKNASDPMAHVYFNQCADHMLTQTEWISEVHNRALRCIAMIRVGIYCNPSGDGSDIIA
jgi:GH24 family phage-related lysozyme (muramidase)